MQVSVIALFYNKWELTHARLFELYKHLPDNCEICLINNGSEEDCDAAVGWWQQKVFKDRPIEQTMRYRKLEQNKGFGGGMNEGVKIAKGDVFIFLSNDVQVSGNFVDEILELLKKNDKVLIGGEVILWKAGWNEFVMDGKPVVIPWANGWLLACTREVWENIGGFDETYGTSDYEDMDVSAKALLLGYNLVALNSKFVKHLVAQTLGYTPERRKHTEENREKFRSKWQDNLRQIANS